MKKNVKGFIISKSLCNFAKYKVPIFSMENIKTYSYDEAYHETLLYFDGNAQAAKVWVDRYALKDSFGHIFEKSPHDMHKRIAKEIARIENKYVHPLSEQDVLFLLDSFRYVIPSGSLMAGIGNDLQAIPLFNSFVIGLEGDSDSYGAIMKLDEEQVQLMKRSCQVGLDLSAFRPKGSSINNAAQVSLGIVPFMKRYRNSAKEVNHGSVNADLKLNISVRHPDSESVIEENIASEECPETHLSLKIDDDFMEAALADKLYEQCFPIDANQPKVEKRIYARKLWEKIVHYIWSGTEMNLQFWNTVIRESLTSCYADFGFKTISSSPSCEIPFSPYDSCCLLSVNLYSYVKNPFTDIAEFDLDLFARHARMAQRIVDDIVDLEIEKIEAILDKISRDPQPEDVKATEYHLWEKIKHKTVLGRRTGIGTIANADTIAALGLHYGSREATDFLSKVHRQLAMNVYRESVNLAQERGAFGIFEFSREQNHPLVKRLRDADSSIVKEMKVWGRRNIACLAIASVPDVALMAQTTNGLEPVGQLTSIRCKNLKNDEQTSKEVTPAKQDESTETEIFYHPRFKDWMKAKGYDTKRCYSAEELNGLVAKSPYYRATAQDVEGLTLVRVAGAVQKWVDQSVCMPVRVPNDTEESQLGRLYVEAWRNGCKVCSISRKDACCDVPVLNGNRKDQNDNPAEKPSLYTPPQVTEVRPKELECDVVRFQNNKEKWVAFVGLLDGYPYEIFTGLQDDEEGILLPKSVTKGKIIKQVNSDGTKRYDFQFENKRGYKTTVEGLSEKFNPEYWNYAKLISGVLRYRMPIEHVIKLVSSLQLQNESINTWKVGVERALKKYIVNGTKACDLRCPVCGQETLVYQDGCLICTNCGASRN